MSLISQTIPNLINGVSQQPYTLRLASQCEEQVNTLPSVVEGLRKRPPTKHVARVIPAPTPVNAFTHQINRDANERYEVIAVNGNLKVYRLSDGQEIVVSFPNGTSYLTTLNPLEDFEALTVADYTFFLNRASTVLEDADLVPPRGFEALCWVKQVEFSTTYTIQVNGVTAAYTTESPTSSTGATMKSEVILANLLTQLQGAGIDATAGYSFQQAGSVLYIGNATVDFTIRVSDTKGDSAFKLIKDSVQNFTDLPAENVINGFRVRVKGNLERAEDDYYVEYKTTPSAPNHGVWTETMKALEKFKLNASTMPHVLVRQSDGTFHFKQATWTPRTVGDLDTIPFASFVGRKIADVFFHRNRLGFLCDENVVMSEAGEFFNFFRTSAIQSLDTDPIDVAATHTKVALLKRAVGFNEQLLLFSEAVQFTLAKTDLLTPKSAAINQTTEFDCQLKARPVGAGQNVYIASERGTSTNLLEYLVDPEAQTLSANNVSDHAPKYVPSGLVKLAASSAESVVVGLSASKRNHLYFYRFYWAGKEKVMSSWGRWEFPATDTIHNINFIGSDLYLTISRPNGTFFEVMSLAPGEVDTPTQMLVHLDRRMNQDDMAIINWFPDLNETHVMLPFGFEAGEEYQVIAWNGDASYKPGQIITPKSVVPSGTQTILVLPKQMTSFWVGRKYGFRYRFSTQIMREEARGGGLQPVREGRLQLRRMTLAYGLSGHFKATVTPLARDPYTYTFSGRIVGSASNPLGSIALNQGTFHFPIASKNDQVTIELTNDTHLPSTFLSAEWEGFFTIRSRRQ